MIFLFNWMISMFHVNLPGCRFGPEKQRLPNSGVTPIFFDLASYRFCRFWRLGFPTWFFRGPFFGATLVAYVAVSPYHQLHQVFFFSPWHRGCFGSPPRTYWPRQFWGCGDFRGPLVGSPCLETPWKHPWETGNPPIFQKKNTFGDFFFNGLNYNAHPFVKFFVFTWTSPFLQKENHLPRFFRATVFIHDLLPQRFPWKSQNHCRFSPKTIF